jgi:hypothetical protein
MGINPRTINYVQGPSKAALAFSVAICFFSIGLGHFLEKQEANRMTRFRDKSALYGGRKGPDDEPSWGDKEYKWRFSEDYAKRFL